ncbi:MAG: aminoglycoside phosphotransferase family protein [Planctomycetes bacterium]|nr:aminoglycoside phosphotransferase family protein [Planctomycetota bacterium]
MKADDRVEIDAGLAGRLIADQFPQWADLPLRPVEPNGWDNRTFRLGDEMTVRLPSADRYVAQVAKEQRWLPRLATRLPLPIPVPLAMGAPAEEYPWPWSVYRWIDGETATAERVDDMAEFATALAEFLAALQRIEPDGGPAPGRHNFFRGGPPATYDEETRDAISVLHGEIDVDAVTAVWNAALDATRHGPPVWLHGDVAASNLLVRDGRLCAVIDFGCTGVGDPACDLAIAWTLFAGESREAFRAAMKVDDATWARGRGWALWKALITLAGIVGPDPARRGEARRGIEAVLSE